LCYVCNNVFRIIGDTILNYIKWNIEGIKPLENNSHKI